MHISLMFYLLLCLSLDIRLDLVLMWLGFLYSLRKIYRKYNRFGRTNLVSLDDGLTF